MLQGHQPAADSLTQSWLCTHRRRHNSRLPPARCREACHVAWPNCCQRVQVCTVTPAVWHAVYGNFCRMACCVRFLLPYGMQLSVFGAKELLPSKYHHQCYRWCHSPCQPLYNRNKSASTCESAHSLRLPHAWPLPGMQLSVLVTVTANSMS